jgi:hypothetical protein
MAASLRLFLGDKMSSWVESTTTIVTTAVGLAGLLGLTKYLVEPWYDARALRRKYATALWISSSDLELHLRRIRTHVEKSDQREISALKKIPNNDARGRADWFTKEGYYATLTAYKISSVVAWLRIYQRELLFVPYAASQGFLAKLYGCADELKRSFSTDTCLWYDYLDAVGDGLVGRPSSAGPQPLAPLSFAEFCERYATDSRFRLFYEQVHMYIHFVASKRPSYVVSVEKVLGSLGDLMKFLTREKLLPGFKVQRPEINEDEMTRSVEHQPARDVSPTA